jgi:XAP5 protein.
MIVLLDHCGASGFTFMFAAVSCTLHFVSLLLVSHAVVNRCFSPQEWAAKQSTLKEEEIDITFSYWDGSGHRRTVRMKKGNWQPLMMYSDV